MLEAKNIVKYYKKVKAVENLSFKLNSGKALGLIGINGSGKTTTFRVLLGLLKADSGNITFKSKPISDYPISLFGYLPEERSLYKELTVFDQIMFLGRLKQMDDESIIQRMEDYLISLNIAEYKYTQINKLSKGNQQKVQILCSIIHDPSIIILDEPLSGLDIINVDLLTKLINDLKHAGKYILLSSHQFEHIEQFCDSLIILKKGKVVYSGNIEELISKSKYHYLLVDKDIGSKYLSNQSIVDYQIIGKLIRFKIDSLSSRNSLFHKILKNEEVKNLAIEEANIETIVKEQQLI